MSPTWDYKSCWTCSREAAGEDGLADSRWEPRNADVCAVDLTEERWHYTQAGQGDGWEAVKRSAAGVADGRADALGLEPAHELPLVGLAAGSEERRIKAGTDEAGVGLTTAGEEARGVRFGTATGLDSRGVVDAAGCEGGAVAGLKI